jgi:hypothetical protein
MYWIDLDGGSDVEARLFKTQTQAPGSREQIDSDRPVRFITHAGHCAFPLGEPVNARISCNSPMVRLTKLSGARSSHCQTVMVVHPALRSRLKLDRSRRRFASIFGCQY